MKNEFWGRGKRYCTREQARKVQDRAILLWLKRGPYEINAQMVQYQATISHKTFWKKVRELLPPGK